MKPNKSSNKWNGTPEIDTPPASVQLAAKRATHDLFPAVVWEAHNLHAVPSSAVTTEKAEEEPPVPASSCLWWSEGAQEISRMAKQPMAASTTTTVQDGGVDRNKAKRAASVGALERN